MTQHLVVVGKTVRQPQRDRIETGRLRGEVEPRRVGAPDDGRQLLQSRLIQPVLGEESVETALLANVRQPDPGMS